MTRRPLSLALLSPLLLLHACGGPLASVEVKRARITSTNVPFSSSGGSGSNLGTITADLGPLGSSMGSGFVTEIALTRLEIAWTNPATRPDFSGVTSASVTVVPPAGSALPEKVVASYTQDPANPNPASLVIVGDASVNLFDYLSGGVVSLRLDAQGTLPAGAWSETATVIADLHVKVEYSM